MCLRAKGTQLDDPKRLLKCKMRGSDRVIVSKSDSRASRCWHRPGVALSSYSEAGSGAWWSPAAAWHPDRWWSAAMLWWRRVWHGTIRVGSEQSPCQPCRRHEAASPWSWATAGHASRSWSRATCCDCLSCSCPPIVWLNWSWPSWCHHHVPHRRSRCLCFHPRVACNQAVPVPPAVQHWRVTAQVNRHRWHPWHPLRWASGYHCAVWWPSWRTAAHARHCGNCVVPLGHAPMPSAVASNPLLQRTCVWAVPVPLLAPARALFESEARHCVCHWHCDKSPWPCGTGKVICIWTWAWKPAIGVPRTPAQSVSAAPDPTRWDSDVEPVGHRS